MDKAATAGLRVPGGLGGARYAFGKAPVLLTACGLATWPLAVSTISFSCCLSSSRISTGISWAWHRSANAALPIRLGEIAVLVLCFAGMRAAGPLEVR